MGNRQPTLGPGPGNAGALRPSLPPLYFHLSKLLKIETGTSKHINRSVGGLPPENPGIAGQSDDPAAERDTNA